MSSAHRLGWQRRRYLKEMDPAMPNGTAACCTAFPPFTSVGCTHVYLVAPS